MRDGPCYDLCACRHCWAGWWGVPFRTRLAWRLDHIRRNLLRRGK